MKSIWKLVLYILCLAFLVLVLFPIIKSLKVDTAFFDFFIVLAIFVILLVTIGLIIERIKVNKILREVEPIYGTVVDMLIYTDYSYNVGDDGKDDFHCGVFPIVKIDGTDKAYVSFELKGYQMLKKVTSWGILSGFNYTIKTRSGKIITIGDRAKVYVKREIENLTSDGNSIIIEGKKYSYAGLFNRENKKKWNNKSAIFNEKSEDFLKELNNYILYEGVLDFEK